MKKNLRTVETGLILGLVLFSMFAVFTPNASAGIIKINPTILVTYPSPNESVVPTSKELDIPLSVSFTLTGVGSDAILKDSLLSKSNLQITLDVVSKDSWIGASIDNPVATIKLEDSDSSKGVWTAAKLHITITGDAPAFTLGSVKISATSTQLNGLLFSIAQVTTPYDVSFQVGYWPVVQYSAPKGNLIQIAPTDTADFEIDLSNIGNYVTYVQITPLAVPEGWSVSVPSSVTIGSTANGGDGATSSAVVHVVVKPPYGFGFHNDVQHFQIQLTPSCQGHPEQMGLTETMTFNVQSVGFSPGGGFEIPLIIIVLVIIGIILYLFIKNIKNRKK